MEEKISIDDFKKVEIRVGEILSAEPVAGSDKLLRLKVNFGLKPSLESSADHPAGVLGEEDTRQVVSGIAKFFPDISVLVGKKCAFATNLQPRMLMGLESQAMLLATGGDGAEPLYLFECAAPAGSTAH